MTDDATGEGAAALPAPAGGGELPELRGRGDERSDAVHSVRAAKCPALSIGDRVEFEGRVSLVGVNGAGQQWVIVALNGEPAHSVACWSSNATQHKSVEPKDRDGNNT